MSKSMTDVKISEINVKVSDLDTEIHETAPDHQRKNNIPHLLLNFKSIMCTTLDLTITLTTNVASSTNPTNQTNHQSHLHLNFSAFPDKILLLLQLFLSVCCSKWLQPNGVCLVTYFFYPYLQILTIQTVFGHVL